MESILEAWKRLQEYILAYPHHGMDEWLVLQSFYNGLTTTSRANIERTVMSPRGGVNRRTYKFSLKCSGLNSLSAKPRTSGFANPELSDLGKTAGELRTFEFCNPELPSSLRAE